MGFEEKLAKRCLKLANNDIDKAIDLIRDAELYDSKSENETSSKQKHFSSRYVPFTDNNIIRMMLFISDELENVAKRCILCQQ